MAQGDPVKLNAVKSVSMEGNTFFKKNTQHEIKLCNFLPTVLITIDSLDCFKEEVFVENQTISGC